MQSLCSLSIAFDQACPHVLPVHKYDTLPLPLHRHCSVDNPGAHEQSRVFPDNVFASQAHASDQQGLR